jgi:hypothetical protein
MADARHCPVTIGHPVPRSKPWRELLFGWYRLTSGHLRITGRRLDAPAPPLSGQTSGYGLTGFNASGVIFPTEGCWQVTGRVGRAALTFVTFVIKGHCDLNAVPIRCVADRAR